jgi:methionine-rich copper-binding protein CopC/ribosomal protein S27AE
MVSADTEKPFIVSFSPADSQGDVPVDAVIKVKFSEDIRSDTLESYITLKDSRGFIVPKTVNYDNFTFDVTIIPIEMMKFDSMYICTVSQFIQDLAGNNLRMPLQWTFNTTKEKEPPGIEFTSPHNSERDVSISTNITVVFSEVMDVTSLSLEVMDSTNTPVIGNLTFAEDALSMSFKPLFNLGYGQTYDVTVPRTVKDLAGNAMAAEYNFKFTVQLEKIRPRVVHIEPLEGAQFQTLDVRIHITFSEPMNSTSLADTVEISDPIGEPIRTTPYYNHETYNLTVAPEQRLKYQTLYTITIKMVALDVAGNLLDREYTSTFNTEPIPQQPPDFDHWSPPDDRFSWYEGQSARFEVSASDPNMDILVYTWKVNGEVVEGETYTSFEFYAEPGSEGSYMVRVEISDGITAPINHFWILDVTPPEDEEEDDKKRFLGWSWVHWTGLVVVGILAAIIAFIYFHLMDRRREILARTRRRLRPLALIRDLGPKKVPSYEEMYLRTDGPYTEKSPEFKPIAAPSGATVAGGATKEALVDTGPVMGDAPQLLEAKEVEIRAATVGPYTTKAPELAKKAAVTASRTCPTCGGKIIEAAHGRLWCDECGWIE